VSPLTENLKVKTFFEQKLWYFVIFSGVFLSSNFVTKKRICLSANERVRSANVALSFYKNLALALISAERRAQRALSPSMSIIVQCEKQ
jgi:hypothetical protein